MFLWCCPMHWYSYGFLDLKEEKMPFLHCTSINHMHQVIYFMTLHVSCEYCLNRAPDYFKSTRLWHYLFHGICTNVENHLSPLELLE